MQIYIPTWLYKQNLWQPQVSTKGTLISVSVVLHHRSWLTKQMNKAQLLINQWLSWKQLNPFKDLWEEKKKKWSYSRLTWARNSLSDLSLTQQKQQNVWTLHCKAILCSLIINKESYENVSSTVHQEVLSPINHVNRPLQHQKQRCPRPLQKPAWRWSVPLGWLTSGHRSAEKQMHTHKLIPIQFFFFFYMWQREEQREEKWQAGNK